LDWAFNHMGMGLKLICWCETRGTVVLTHSHVL
jgi:hypothetical protein